VVRELGLTFREQKAARLAQAPDDRHLQHVFTIATARWPNACCDRPKSLPKIVLS
jgi:hypothetical protein